MHKHANDYEYESDLVHDALVALSKRYHPRGVFTRRNVGLGKTENGSTVRFNIPGMADISGILCGIACELEAKIKNRKQSEKQKYWETAVTSAGGVYILFYDVQSLLDSLDVIFAERMRTPV